MVETKIEINQMEFWTYINQVAEITTLNEQ